MRIPSSLLLPGVLALASASCASFGEGLATTETTLARVFISDEQESQLGLQVKQELETKQNVRYLADPQVVEYVRGVANKVLAVASAERPEVKWTVNVIDDPKTINAFATPGGYLYVYTGLLLLADNEAELAGVMGHEAGHVVGRHSARQMVDAYGLQAVASLALGNNPNLLAQLGTQIAQKGTMLAHSRGIEDEADEYGARYASKAGYDPLALARFFEKLKAQTGDTSGILTWLSDHPATSDRIAHITAYTQQNALAGKDLGADRFLPIRKKIQSMPAAPAAGPSSGAPSAGPSNGAPPGGPMNLAPAKSPPAKSPPASPPAKSPPPSAPPSGPPA